MCEQPIRSLHLTWKCKQPTGCSRRKEKNDGNATLYKNSLTNRGARSRSLPNHKSYDYLKMSTGAPSSGGIGRTMAQATSFCERLPPTLSTSLGWWNGRQAATFGSHTTHTHTHTHLYTNPEHTIHHLLCKEWITHRRSTPCSFC